MGLKCEIHLEKPADGVYRPGAIVSGYIQYFLNKEIQFESIRLGLKGRSECSWKEKSRSENGSRSRFEAKEQIIDMDRNILTTTSGFLPAGLYSETFRFQLPETVPPTFKYHGDGCSAQVSYCVRAKFTFASFFSFPANYRFDITVANTIKPTLPLEPVTYGLQDTLNRKFGFVGKPVDADLKVTISKSFLAPSESADLCLQVTNNTKYSIPQLKITLYEVLTLNDDIGRSKTILKEIKECREKTEKVKKSNYSCMYSTIPLPSDLSTMQGSRIISRDYKIVVIMSIPEIKRETTLDIPIQIGYLLSANEQAITNQEAENVQEMTRVLPDSIHGSSTSLVVNNNNYIHNQSVTVNPGPSATGEAPPAYWDVMGEAKKS